MFLLSSVIPAIGGTRILAINNIPSGREPETAHLMHLNSKIVTLGLLISLIGLGVAATKPPVEDPEKSNLKVLPKKLSDNQMDMIMERISRQLGVTCEYCHVPTKPDVFPKRMDFASDEKTEKLIARRMIRMCIQINRKYFAFKSDWEAVLNPKVSCRTCHRGFPRPKF